MDNDLTLIDAFRAGDQAAFTELVKRHREHVFRLAVSILGNGFEGDAEEVAQEVFVRVHRGLAAFRGDAKFSTWLYRIAFNQAVNLKARLRYRAPHLGDEVLETARSKAADPLRQVEEARRDRALMDAIHELPEVYQSALRLHYWMDTGIAEVAVLLDVPENTVKSYLHRARKLLHAMLQERGFENV